MPNFTKPLVLIGLLLVSAMSSATVVKFETSMGDFEVNLYDESTPATVANFLAYVEAERYKDVLVHRSVPGFVVQAGGTYFDENDEFQPIPLFDSVINEPKWSNVRGTIAMAKLGGNPNSATSQWFFNLKDNSGGSSSLDTQNGGFTVFGQVMGDGMEIVDAIAALPTYNEAPVNNYTQTDYDNGVALTRANYVIIEAITVIDSNVVTNPDLTPKENTLINSSTTTPPTDNGGGSSGGSFAWLSLLAVGLLFRRK